MKVNNHERAKKSVESWPSWKREVSLTKYSSSSTGSQKAKSEDKKRT